MNKDQSKPVLTATEILSRVVRESNDEGNLRITEREALQAMEEYHSQFEKQRGGLDVETVEKILNDNLFLDSKEDSWELSTISRQSKKDAAEAICQLSPKEDALRKDENDGKFLPARNFKPETKDEMYYSESDVLEAFQRVRNNERLSNRKEVEELKDIIKQLKAEIEEYKSGNRLTSINTESHTLTADQIAEALPSDEEINSRVEELYLTSKIHWHKRKKFYVKEGMALMRQQAIERLSRMIPAKEESSERLPARESELLAECININSPSESFREESKWISVEERLPENSQRVLCYGKGDRMFTAIFSKGNFLALTFDGQPASIDPEDESECVTHWKVPSAPQS